MTAATFPFGTHVYREPHLPLDALLHDLDVIRRLGFSMVKIQECWSADEPREGEVELTPLVKVLDKARALGLGVYFGVTMEQAPAWLWAKYPDASMVYEDGARHNDPTQYCLPADGKPGPCWHHPGARAAAQRFITELLANLARYQNILVWNTWQEIGFWPNRPGHLGFCYCPHSLAAFRSWLREKYRDDLAALNGVWRTNYGSWDFIEPPRMSAAVPSWIDWRTFMDDVYLAWVLHWKAAAFETYDPHRRPVMAHVASPTVGSGSAWRWAAEQPIFGSSSYPAWSPFHQWDAGKPSPGKPAARGASLCAEAAGIALSFDYLRRAVREGGQLWAAEFQGGPISTHLHKGRVPDPADIRRWVLTALSTGIAGLCFWNHRAEPFWMEINGFGLLDSAGDSTPRAEEAGRLARAVAAHADLFTGASLVRPELAILVNGNLWQYAQGTADFAGHLAYDMRGWHRLCWEQGIPVDFVDSSQLPGILKEYRAIVVPAPLALEDALMRHLRDYVNDGGRVICEAAPGRLDTYGIGRTGELSPEARTLFGVTHESVAMVYEPGDATWMPAERTWGEFAPATPLQGAGRLAGTVLQPCVLLETFAPTTSAPLFLASDGKVAGVVNTFGTGHAYLIGTILGHAVTGLRDAKSVQAMLALLADAGVRPQRVGALNLRRRVASGGELWFLTNLAEEPVTERVPVPAGMKVQNLLEGELSPTEGAVTVSVEPLGAACLVLRVAAAT
ncbi:MAG: beta-galactosidase [Planctomycetota bacterium]|nr:beta-galactosidase [Planctomycetota bacterium]